MVHTPIFLAYYEPVALLRNARKSMTDKPKDIEENLLNKTRQIEADIARIEDDLSAAKVKLAELGFKLKAYQQSLNDYFKEKNKRK